MKISKRQLKRLIRAEKQALLKEAEFGGDIVQQIIGMIDDKMLRDKQDENWQDDPRNIAQIQDWLDQVLAMYEMYARGVGR